MMSLPFRKFVVTNFAKRTDDIVNAVRLLRQHGLTVGFPMQTADGKIIFAVGKHTLTAAQILELLERGELNAEGVQKLVESQSTTLKHRQAASS